MRALRNVQHRIAHRAANGLRGAGGDEYAIQNRYTSLESLTPTGEDSPIRPPAALALA
jgi:hypothetical protein